MTSTKAPQQPTSASPANPLAPDHGRRVTKEEYWAKWYQNPYPRIDVSYEWINGILQAKPPSNHPQIKQYHWFLSLISLYTETYPIADLIHLNCGVSMTVPDPAQPSGEWDVVYKPDLGVIRHDNPAPWGAVGQYAFEGVCDICVEEISDASPEEVRRDTHEKKKGYAIAGVKEYYILDPEDRHMRFYRLTDDRRYEEIEPDALGILRSHVLPGFQFRRADLLKQPAIAQLSIDEIYADYVFPGHLDSALRVQKEEERAAAAAEARRLAEEPTPNATEQAAAEAETRRLTEEITQALKAEIARHQAKERAAILTAARLQAEERAERAEKQAAAETAARRQAEERAKRVEEQNQALQAKLASLRRQRP